LTDHLIRLERYLWSILELSPDITSRVRIGNRIKYCDPTNPNPNAKPALLNADLPEIELRPVGMQSLGKNTSASMSALVTFRVILNTGMMQTEGDGQTDPQLGITSLMWAIYVATVRAMDGNVRGFRAPSVPFVRTVRVNTIEQNASQSNDNLRYPDGWQGVLDISCECHFSLQADIGGFR
jgi:hypothetical protein